ncbi:AAA family ATPase [Desulfotruncus alcoholivorax]|uniref:AAA family ATPase n=1 Tax=Desulfotruncus alcoholivorax TaxID=265477 RepID=UPI0004257428|nr:AAA family ATPase [Desulfotruncus alcoholivorax]
MRLSGLYIYNYGVLTGFSLTDNQLSGGLSIIFGLNEAGKSTLLSFIRGVLFGFKTEGNLAKPVWGGEAGGYLLLEDNGDIYRVERSGKGNGSVAVELPGGGRAGEELLKTRLLRGLSPVLFKNVFAFGIDELRRLEELERDEISAYIYGAGTGTSPRRLADAAAALEKTAGELYKPRGRTPRLNKLILELEELDRKIRELEQQPERYFKLLEEQRQLERDRDRLRELQSERQARLRRLDYLLKARAPWNDLRQCLAQMERLPVIPAFPEHGTERLGELEARLNAKQEEVLGWSGKIQALQKKLASITVEEQIVAAAHSIDELDKERSLYLEKKQSLIELDARIAEIEKTARERMAMLGPGWDEARVLALDTSLAARRRVEDLAVRSAALEQQKAIAANRLETCRKEYDRTRLEQENTAAQLAGLPPASGNKVKIEEKMELLDQAVAGLEQLNHGQELREIQQNRLQEIYHRLERNLLQQKQAAQNKVLVVAVIAAVLMGCSGFWMIYSNLPYGLWVGSAGLCALLLLGGLNWMQAKERRDKLKELSVEAEELGRTRENLARAIERLDRSIKTASEQLSRAEAVFKGGKKLQREEIPALRRRFMEERDNLRRKLELAARLENNEKGLAAAERELRQAETDLEQITRNLHQVQIEWEKWLNGMGLSGLTLSGAAGFLSLAEKAADELKKLRLERRAAEQTRRYVTDYEDRVNGLAAALGRGMVPREEVAGRVAGMVEYLREQQKMKAELDRCRADLELALAGQKTAGEGLQLVRAKIKELLDMGGAVDHEDFRHRAAAYRERRELAGKAEDLRGHLLNIAGTAAELAELERELEQTKKSSHEEEYDRIKAELESGEKQLAVLGDELAAVKQEMKILESGEELARARQKREMLRESLATGAREWQVAVLCSTLLDLAREKHERERQPAVLAHASRLISPLTGRRYNRVLSPVGSPAALEVEEPAGRRVGASALSRGAAGQLYLALRLALACHFCSVAVPMPVILDDVMVDFDSHRLRGSLQALGRIAREHQVLLFTCHNHIVEAAKEIVTGLNLVLMDGGRKTAPSQ